MKLVRQFTISLMVFSGFSIAEVTEISILDFGKIVISSNNAASQAIVNRNGGAQYVGNIFPVSPPHRAEFALTNFPPNTTIFISATSIQATSNSEVASNEQFKLDNIDTPSSIVTNSNGSATLYVGGTLQTSGSGSNAYTNTNYSLKYRLDLNY